MPPADQPRVYLELQPIVPLDQWWHIGLLVVAVGLLVFFAVWIIRRDSRLLPKPLTWLLTGLRLGAIAFLILYLLGLGQRSESRLVTDSKLAVLVDTSLSMGLTDQVSQLENVPRRIDQVVQWLESQPELDALRQQHSLMVYRFGDSSQPELIAEFPKTPNLETLPVPATTSSDSSARLAFQFGVATWALAATAVALILVVAFQLFSSKGTATSRASWLAATVATVMFSLILAGASDLADPSAPVVESLGLRRSTESNEDDLGAESAAPEIPVVDWKQELTPAATGTAAGSAIQFLVNKERGSSLAGIILFTDGQSNAGIALPTAGSSAANANIPIYPVGIGDHRPQVNVEVADVQAPPRVLPKDRFRLKTVIKSIGLATRNVGLKIVSTDEQGNDPRLEHESAVTLGDDGELIPIEVELESEGEGRRVYSVEVDAAPGEFNRADNVRTVTVEAIQRKTKVLLMAGGPNREFRFLRNQLFRDSEVTSHVWLQSARSGADQEADELLTEFPSGEEELFSYDCLIAFDPDWRQLSQSQTEMLERWVAEKSGGLILIAGPVNTPEWTRRPRGDESIDVVRQLYPVSFFNQGSAQLKLGRFGGTQPFPLSFTREGRAARFLWLGDSSQISMDTWGQFEGVFGYYAVNETKAGADVLASFSDPETQVEGQLPIYLASQFYGSGRVFFQASAEMWRVRRIEVDYFQTYYNRLIRWASQGRLLRDSNRGVLLADRDRCWMGDQVVVRAILRDTADEPLLAESATATVLRPNGERKQLELKSTGGAARPGTFSTIVNTPVEGEYRVTLPIPESVDFEVLSTTIYAGIPDQEKAKPERNDAGLSELAQKTNGQYYAGMESFRIDSDDPLSPTTLIVPQDQEAFLTGTLDRHFRQKLMIWLLVWLVSGLALEWTVRRLHKLS